jgi:hypothetical protein
MSTEWTLRPIEPKDDAAVAAIIRAVMPEFGVKGLLEEIRSQVKPAVAIAVVVAMLGAMAARADESGKPAGHAVQTRPPRNEALQQTLLKMGQEDQADATLAYQGPVPNAAERAQRRVALLKQIIAEYGWPGMTLVGEDGANAAWLIAQHADFDVPFQRQCLALVEEAYRRSDVTGMHLAYLTDRVLAAEHRPQLYGTQGAPVYTDEEKAQVEARRKKLGLPSMAEMARERGKMYQRVYQQAR